MKGIGGARRTGGRQGEAGPGGGGGTFSWALAAEPISLTQAAPTRITSPSHHRRRSVRNIAVPPKSSSRTLHWADRHRTTGCGWKCRFVGKTRGPWFLSDFPIPPMWATSLKSLYAYESGLPTYSLDLTLLRHVVMNRGMRVSGSPTT